MGLDKFYTQTNVSKQCYDWLLEDFVNLEEELFLEPSAGNGSFLNYLKKYIALDIVPEDSRIIKQDFLQYTTDQKNFITIGNPPFGSRSKMAVNFFNKAATMSEIIAFIVPVSFMKWNVQKQLDKNFALHNFYYLEPESFTVNNKPYAVRTVFQIWVKKNSKYFKNIDLRLTQQPPISHSDFNIWQYNATPESVKYIEENWKYATYRQGYNDYNKIFTRNDYNYIKEKMTGKKKQQFFFIEPLTKEAENIILNMDFNSLAERNTTTPGFGKGDFVSYYDELKNK